MQCLRVGIHGWPIIVLHPPLRSLHESEGKNYKHLFFWRVIFWRSHGLPEESSGGEGDFSYDNKIKEQEHTGTVLFPEHVPGTPREIPSLVNTTKGQKIYESCHVTHE